MKKVVLVIVFLIPIFILLFLNIFGKNEYKLPIMEATMHLEDTLYLAEKSPKIQVIGYVSDNVVGKTTILELDRVMDMMGKIQGYEVTLFVDSQSIQTKLQEKMYLNSDTDKIRWVVAPNESSIKLMNKLFYDKEVRRNFALLDQRGDLRGTFDMSDTKEADRLNVEVQILTKETEEAK